MASHNVVQRGHDVRGTASTMRSCASLSQISHGAQAGVLQRGEGQIDVGADAFGHFADRRRQAARPAVGDGAV